MVDKRLKSLQDILDAGRAIQLFARDRTVADYRSDLMFRSAVERQFGIIGEALRRVDAVDGAALQHISEARRIIGFRNIIAHGYDGLDDATVWQAITDKLPLLLTEAAALLAKFEGLS